MPEIKLTWEEFEEQFKPIQNTITNREEFDGWLFETYGEDLEHIHNTVETLPNNVWTILDVGDYFVIGEGYHHINRVGYIITEVPYDPNNSYEVVDPEDVAVAEYRERLDAEAEERYGPDHDIVIDTHDILQAIFDETPPSDLLINYKEQE